MRALSWRVFFPTFREIGKCSVEWVPNQTLSQNTPQAALLSIYFHFMFSLQVFHCIQENNGFTRLWKRERNRREREIEREIVREKWRDRQRETQKERLKREREWNEREMENPLGFQEAIVVPLRVANKWNKYRMPCCQLAKKSTRATVLACLEIVTIIVVVVVDY